MAAVPLEGPGADRTLSGIPAVSATATAVEAAIRSKGSIHILPFTRLSLPSTPLVPTPLASPFRAVTRRNLRAWPSDSRTNTSTGPRPRLAHIPLPGGLSACAARAHSEGNSRRPTMPKASPPLGSPFGAVGAGESVVWDRSYRKPDRVRSGATGGPNDSHIN